MAARRARSEYGLVCTVPLALFFLAFFVAPLLLLTAISFAGDGAGHGFGLAQYGKFLSDSYSLGVLGATLRLGVEVTLVCLALGYPFAWFYVRAPRRARTPLLLIVLLPLLTSVIVRTFAWIVILGRQGIVNSSLMALGWIDTPLRLLYTEGGVIVALAQVLTPLMTLPIITSLSRLDRNYADASSALGASAWRTFLRITVPLSMPGILAGCVLTFASAVTAFVTQNLIGGGQRLFMPMYIYQQATALENWPFAAAIAVLFLLSVLAVLSLLNVIAGFSRGIRHAA